MRLTQFSDYSLRTVLYLGANPSRLVPITEIAEAYRISYHHLTKVATLLIDIGVVQAMRGRNGGLRLSVPAGEINIGWLIRQTETDMDLVECFDSATDECPITRECRLRAALQQALQAFLGVLDEYTLADFLGSAPKQTRLLQLWRAHSAAV